MESKNATGKASEGRRIGRTLAVVLMLLNASCTSLLGNGTPPSSYAVLTDAGPVLVDADGFAHGFTQAALEASVRKAMIQAHRGQLRVIGVGEVTPTRRMLLHVEEGFRPTRAQVTLELFRAGKLVKSVSMAAPEPGAFPESVFIRSVADLARRLLPPVGPNATTLSPYNFHA
jgi:hypothetical protein